MPSQALSLPPPSAHFSSLHKPYSTHSVTTQATGVACGFVVLGLRAPTNVLAKPPLAIFLRMTVITLPNPPNAPTPPPRQARPWGTSTTMTWRPCWPRRRPWSRSRWPWMRYVLDGLLSPSSSPSPIPFYVLLTTCTPNPHPHNHADLRGFRPGHVQRGQPLLE